MKKVLKLLCTLVTIFLLGIFGVNFYVQISTSNLIVDSNSKKIENNDCALVLGAAIWNGKPSPMLKDRLDVAINLYKEGVVPKIIMSGDHRENDYDEVNVMKKYAVINGVKSEDVFMDHAGLSTYDSMYRAKEIFKAKKIVIVTQKYHLYRSLYIGKSLDLKVYGIEATPIKYSGQMQRDLREILARDKDFIKSIFKPKPEYLGGDYPVNGDGNTTNDGKLEY